MSSPDKQPIDAAARQRALDPQGSFAVSAPAGSGKTGLITQRVLKLLARCDKPEEILGITFTRKAAQEMQFRINKALQEAAAGEPPKSPHDQLTFELAREVLTQDQEKNWGLLITPSRLRIQTIDAFCQSITRQLPIAAGPSAYLETTENASGLYRAAVHKLFEELRNEGPLAEALGMLLRHMDNNLERVESLLMQLLQQRSQWLGPLYSSRGDKHYFETSLQVIIADTLSKLNESLQDCLGELEDLLRFATDNRLRNGDNLAFTAEDIDLLQPADSQSAIAVWQALVDLCLTASGDWRKRLDNRCGFPAPSSTKLAAEKALFTEKKTQMTALLQELAERPQLLDLLQDVRCLPKLQVELGQWQLLQSLTLLLPQLAALFQLHCAQVGETDFNEVAIAASRALGDEDNPSDLALKLDYQIKHILVDEFQDTSLPQLQLLEKLTAGWQAGDGRTLFIVGDAMQSCYGFRDANVGIFIQARELGIGSVPLEALNLSVNFRSEAKLVEWVNAGFRDIFPAVNDVNRGAVCYSTAHPCAPGTAGLIEARAFVDSEAQAQARHLVELLQRELAEHEGSIAILARSRSQLQDILRELRLANIDWQAQDIDALRDRMAVIDLLSLTRALLDFSDRVAWLSILRAPWCGLDLHDLHTLANHPLADNPALDKAGRPLLWGQIRHCEQLPLSATGQALLQRLRNVLQAVIAQQARKPLRQWIEGIWLALGGPAAVANPAESHSPKHFFALLEQHALGGQLRDWEEFETALASLYDKAEQSARLQVMTIHKSKGLEFDTVIVPKLDKGTRGDDKPLLLWQEYRDASGHSHLLISPLAAVGEEDDSLYNYLKRERSLRQQYESARLLYVACTRAVSKLYLLMDLQRDEKTGELKPPSKNSLAGHLWNKIQSELILVENEQPLTEGSEDSFLQAQILRLPVNWQPPAWPRDESLAAFRGRQFSPENNLPDVAPLRNRRARYLGTVLHRALQQVTVEGLAQWSEQRIAEQLPGWAAQLRQLGLSRAGAEAQLIAQSLRATLQDPTGRWLLDNSHEDSRCELSLTTAGAGYRESVIDRSFIAEGQRWIVDYKSVEIPSDQNRREFLAATAAQYRSQLQLYARLMQKLDQQAGRSLPVRTALYFLELGLQPGEQQNIFQPVDWQTEE